MEVEREGGRGREAEIEEGWRWGAGGWRGRWVGGGG